MLAAALGIGTLAMAAVWLFAPLLAQTLYRQAELLPLLQGSCILVPVIALSQVTGGVMNALGMTRISLRISMAVEYAGFILLALVCLLPFALMLLNATQSHADLSTGLNLLPGTSLMDNYKTLISEMDIWKNMLNSLIIAVPGDVYKRQGVRCAGGWLHPPASRW